MTDGEDTEPVSAAAAKILSVRPPPLRCPAMPLDERFTGLPVTAHDGLLVIEARTHRSRRRGLSRLHALPAEHALHIPQTPSVHTFGMRFALDLIWLDGAGNVVRVDREVAPRRMRFCRSGRSVIECNGGQADLFLSAGVGGGAGHRLSGAD